MRIGELAARSGVSVKALRHYEAIGVLAPPPRTPAGYRVYDEGALGRLDFVRSAQAVGLTLGEIREVVAFRERGEVPCARVLALLQAKAAGMAGRIAELERTRLELERLAARAAGLRPEDCPAGEVCHLIAPGRP